MVSPSIPAPSLSPSSAPSITIHHHGNLPNVGPIESGTHCHLDPIADQRHPNRLAHLEPELRGPDSLADNTARHRRPHGLADCIPNYIDPDRLATGY